MVNNLKFFYKLELYNLNTNLKAKTLFKVFQCVWWHYFKTTLQKNFKFVIEKLQVWYRKTSSLVQKNFNLMPKRYRMTNKNNPSLKQDLERLKQFISK